MNPENNRILLIITKNTGSTPYQLQNQEIEKITDIFNEGGIPCKFNVISEGILDWRHFQRSLLHYSPEIIHYTNSIDISSEITDYIIRALGTDNKLRCVFFNAPYSSKTALLVSKYVNFTIGFSGDVDDLSSLDFVLAFYDAVSFGKDYQSAFEIALITYDRDISFIDDAIIDKGPVLYNKEIRTAQQAQIRKFAPTRLPLLGRRIVGRVDEIDIINKCWNSNTSILIVEAWGGVGKTTLANEWRTRIINNYNDELNKVFDWSFSRQGEADGVSNSSDDFLDQALEWFSVKPAKGLSSYEIGKLLAVKVQNNKNLIILDGIEAILSSNNYNPDSNGIILDNAVSSFLMTIAEYNKGLCIITTRRHIADLESFPNCQLLLLNNLNEESSKKLMVNSGISGDEISFSCVFNKYHGHPLTLSLLCGYVRDYLGGNLDQFVSFDIFKQDKYENGHASDIMKYYDSILDEDTQVALLRLLSLFDRPVRYQEIEKLILSKYSFAIHLPSFRSIEWIQLIRSLKNSQLLTEIRTNNEIQLDVHPMIRDHYYEQLVNSYPEEFIRGNDILYHHFLETAINVKSEKEKITLLLRAISFGCRANHHVSVYNEIYLPYIKKDILAHDARSLGGYGTSVDSIACFFKEKWNSLYEFEDKMKADIFSEASFALMCIGEIETAVVPLKLAIDIELKLLHFEEVATYYGNLSELYLLSGKIEEAKIVSEKGLSYANICDRIGRHNWAQMTKHANVLCHLGEYKAALKEFKDAELLQREYDLSAPTLYGILAYKMFDVSLSVAENNTLVEQLLNVPKKIGFSTQELEKEIRKAISHDKKTKNYLHLGAVYTALGRLLVVDSYYNNNNTKDEALKAIDYAIKYTLRGGRKEYILYAELAEAFAFSYYKIETDKSLIARIKDIKTEAKHYDFRLVFIDASLLLIYIYITSDMIENAYKEYTAICQFESVSAYKKREIVFDAIKQFLASPATVFKKVSHNALLRIDCEQDKKKEVARSFKNIHK